MTFKLWTQIADYSSKDYGRVTFKQAAEKIRTFAWEEEFQRFAEVGDGGCPPGVGVGHGGEWFHVYATGPSEWGVYISLKRDIGVLAWLPWSSRKITGEVSSLDEVIPLLKRFFDGDRERLAAKARQVLR